MWFTVGPQEAPVDSRADRVCNQCDPGEFAKEAGYESRDVDLRLGWGCYSRHAVIRSYGGRPWARGTLADRVAGFRDPGRRLDPLVPQYSFDAAHHCHYAFCAGADDLRDGAIQRQVQPGAVAHHA